MRTLTDLERRVLQGLADRRIPESTAEFEAYQRLRDSGLADYNPAERRVTPTVRGYKALDEAAQP